MFPQISHTPDFERRFLEKRCSLSAGVYRTSEYETKERQKHTRLVETEFTIRFYITSNDNLGSPLSVGFIFNLLMCDN